MPKVNPDFILLLGDNFYNNGVTGVDDPQWQTTFQEVFKASSLQVSNSWPLSFLSSCQ